MGKEANILVVDDSVEMRFVLGFLIQEYCHKKGLSSHIFTAENAQKGAEIIEEFPIVLIFSELQLPGEDGAAFIEKVFKRSPEIFSVLMAERPQRARLKCPSASDFLGKPVYDKDLADVLNRAFEKIAQVFG